MEVGPAFTARAAGTIDRDWVLERRAAPIAQPLEQISTSTVCIPMRDGVQLSGQLYSPVGAGPLPGVVIANGYGASLDPQFAETIAQLAGRGYLVLFARMRGTKPSEGKGGLYEQFGPDTHDLIEWLGQHRACDGNVGMAGASLLGLVQYLGAREAPRHLKALLPDDAGADNYWYLWHPGGMSSGPGRQMRNMVEGAENEYALALEHPDYDTFWRDRTIQESDLKAIAARGVAVFLTSGWDSYMLGSAKSFEWLKSGNPGKRLKMFVGPWGHGSFMAPDAMLAGQSVLPFTGFEYAVLWLDRWLKGIANGVEDQLPVLLYVQGPNEWRFERDWPIPDEYRVRLYMRARRAETRAGLNDGRLSIDAPTDDASATYRYSPEGPFNAVAVNALTRPRFDKSGYEEHALCWTTEPLEVATELTGYVRVEFWASLSGRDTDFVIEVTDVSPADDGHRLQSFQVTRGYLNARSFSSTNPPSLTPGTPYRFQLELYPTSYVFAAGHRIRIVLQGAAFDPQAKATLDPIIKVAGVDPAVLTAPQGPGLHNEPVEITLLQDAACPSFVELPIIGSGWLSLVAR
ncbi:MAG: CocE/NonD family hydrolase [Steroidobacteraceae bacterium]